MRLSDGAALLLALTLALAALWDIRAQRIPNWLTLTGLVMGLVIHAWPGRWPGLRMSLEGIAVAGFALFPYAVHGLGAGDVKLLAAVGALMGPQFLLWTALGTVLFGGLLAIVQMTARGAWRAGKMPLAPAIALGASFAAAHLYGRAL